VPDGEKAILSVNAFAGTARVDIVPEPSTLALLGLAAGFCWLRRKQ
jgi:hypothetical protein